MHARIMVGGCLLALFSAMAVFGQRGVVSARANPNRSQTTERRAGRYEHGSKQADMAGSYDHPILPETRQNVKVVYQIKTDALKKGVGAGLHYLDKLAGAYDDMGIKVSDRKIVGVFHGDAGHFLLDDSAYRKASGKAEENPNKQIVQKLLDEDVQLELCKSTMLSHGWTGEDVLPGVKIVVGAYPRIIDLQLRGYAYIRF